MNLSHAVLIRVAGADGEGEGRVAAQALRAGVHLAAIKHRSLSF